MSYLVNYFAEPWPLFIVASVWVFLLFVCRNLDQLSRCCCWTNEMIISIATSEEVDFPSVIKMMIIKHAWPHWIEYESIKIKTGWELFFSCDFFFRESKNNMTILMKRIWTALYPCYLKMKTLWFFRGGVFSGTSSAMPGANVHFDEVFHLGRKK